MSCPACAGHVEFPDEGIGMTIDCPHCQASVLLRPEEALPETPPPELPPKNEAKFSQFQTSDGEIFGQFSKSPNKDYTLVWSDRWICGQSKSGGPFYLFHNGKEICKGKIERPNDGSVANNGNFIFCDWLFSQELESIFYAFNYRGETIIKQKLDANLLNAALSDDGLYAACQTATNDDGYYSDTLLAFDLKSCKEIWHSAPPFRAENYTFDTQKLELAIRGTSPIYRSCILTLVPPPPKKRKAKRPV